MIVTELYQPKTRRQLEESRILKSSTYKQFHSVGRMLAERKMTEKEILDVFAQAEADMTNKDTGANRTVLGRGKDVVGKGITSAKDAISGVLNSIQNSAPVAGVDVAYDQATDALANLTGGEKSKIMDAVKKYRLLAKEYPKTQLFVKTALIALAGLATGGAGLPAIAGLTAAVDSAIKGEKLSSVIGKGAGAALMGLGAQKVNAMLQTTASGDELDSITGSNSVAATPDAGGTDYVVQKGDTLSQIAQKNNVSVKDLLAANNGATTTTDLTTQGWNNSYYDAFSNQNAMGDYTGPTNHEYATTTAPKITNPDVLKPGQVIKIPSATGSSVYDQGVGTAADTWDKVKSGEYTPSEISRNQAAKWNLSGAGEYNPPGGAVSQAQADAMSGRADNLANMQAQAGANATAPAVSAKTAGASTGVNDAEAADAFYNPKAGLTPAQRASLEYSQDVANPPKGYEAGVAQDQDGNVMPGWNLKNINGKNWYVTKESINYKIIPAADLFDSELTAAVKKLNESHGVRSKSVQLTYEGVYTVIENVDRYRKAILEAVGPGREQLPDYYRPDMPGAPAPQTAQPGMVGRGLNWLDKAAGKVGGALSTFGRQFTTGVTKEKLKMNWHQAGKPTDSDQLAAFLAQQKVPQEVITDVFGKMGIPYAAPAAAEPAATAATTATQDKPDAQPAGGYEQEIPLARINPATGKAYLPSEIPAYVEPKAISQAKKDIDIERQEQEVAAELERERLKSQMQSGERQPGDWRRARELAGRPVTSKDFQNFSNKMMPSSTGMQKLAKDLKSPTPSFAQGQAQPAGFNAANAMNLPGMEKYAKPAAAQSAATPNFARQNTGYSSVKMNAPTSIKSSTAPTVPATPTAPTAPTVPATPTAQDASTVPATTAGSSGTYNRKTGAAKLGGKTMTALKDLPPEIQKKLATTETVKRVSAMLESIKTKKDIVKIRNYINNTLVNENQSAFRTALHQKVTEVAAVKRRIAARNAAK